MHLRSITMKGFKSFPERTRLEFAEGVSVIVGPNGSGKSNVTDAVLWALGEQSPLAVRGQTMQDVIYSGGPGLPSRAAAEVEVVIDDSDFELGMDFSELSITRRLERSGDGEYRLNGARCRLVDVLEALSDTGLGKEMHSVVSQGRVEAVIHSSPRDRRLLIEEAAGLGKHRKRRRRAELKLGRTEENLARALDVEREARSHLRPLKRQAEAAELHERLERQVLEARHELVRDRARIEGKRRAAAESDAAAARARRGEAEERLAAVRARRESAEGAFAEHARRREALSGDLFAATTAVDRVEMRLERVSEVGGAAARDAARLREELGRLEAQLAAEGPGSAAHGQPAGGAPHTERLGRLEAELAALDAASGERPDEELGRLRAEREEAERGLGTLEDAVAARRAELKRAEVEIAPLRKARREAGATLEAARTESARARADLDAVRHLARSAAPAIGEAGALAEHLRVEPGYEPALAAALGPLVRAGVAEGLAAGSALLDAARDEGAALIVDAPPAGGQAPAPGPSPAGGPPPAPDPPSATDHSLGEGRGNPPAPGAERLLDRVTATPRAAAAAERLLRDAWVVRSLSGLASGFSGIAVTRSGRAFVSATGELRQVAEGSDDRLLERLSRHDALVAQAEAADRSLERAERAADDAARVLSSAERFRDEAAEAVRAAARRLDSAEEGVRAAARAVARREEATDRSIALRRAELTAELRAERRIAERAERERRERRVRCERITARIERAKALAAAAGATIPALEAAAAAVAAHRESLRAELDAGEAEGARTGEELRACAHEEAEVQGELRTAGELVTGAEVAAQRARDAAAEVERELADLATRVQPGDGADAGTAPALDDARRAELEARLERLARRRERLGPVNPLAKAEYEEAVVRVEELQAQREDLETALSELRGVIRETDRRIRESFERTFEATAKNFEEVVEELFPGGRGRLRLVSPGSPRPVLGGDKGDSGAASGTGEAGNAATGSGLGEDESAEGEPEEAVDEREPGVEVEVTPAGKSMRRLSLLSGGERSLVALAFLFAVFLARPCPFYVLDEVEAALDDVNIDRFLRLVRRCSDRAQFIVVTHQKRTMDAADRLYGVSMGRDGISKVVSRRLTRRGPEGRVGEAAA